MIPSTIHIIWVGDETKRPDNCIQTWVDLNPDWEVKIWGNKQLAETDWINTNHMRAMSTRELNGVADMMRWEILYREGGFVVDADSICIRALDMHLRNRLAFTCWESEVARPGLLAAGYVACKPGNPFIHQIIKDIRDETSVVNDMAWKTVGPQRLTDSFRKYSYHDLDIFPSHYFIPEHFTGVRYDGSGVVYARQEWATTKRAYDTLFLKRFDAAGHALPNEGAETSVQNTATPITEESQDSGPITGHEEQQATEASAPTQRTSPLERQHAPYFVQRTVVGRELQGRSRIDVFAQLCRGRRVLHIGCADWPITDPKTSLHIALEPHCVQLDGFDTQEEGLSLLKPYTKGQLFSRLEDIAGSYDLLLVPEVLEHVPHVADFLRQVDGINAPHVVVTVPDVTQCMKRHFDYLGESETALEIVHPDHNCWYSPYTLANVIRKYTNWHIDGIWFFNSISLLAIMSKRSSVHPQ